MSTPMDMHESQARNEFGYVGCPSVQAAPGAAVHSHVDQSTNKPLPWIVLNAVIGSMALMGVILMPVIIDAKVRANSATCELALKTAYTAKDQTDIFIVKQKSLLESKQ